MLNPKTAFHQPRVKRINKQLGTANHWHQENDIPEQIDINEVGVK